MCMHIKNMTTFRDFLVYNNDLDVGPFVQPVQKMQQFYFEQGKLYSHLSDEKNVFVCLSGVLDLAYNLTETR